MRCYDTSDKLRLCLCVLTRTRNTYPGVGSVLRAIIACRPEDSLRPVLSYPSTSLATVPRQTHDHNPSFPFSSPRTRSLSFFLSCSFWLARDPRLPRRRSSLPLSLSLPTAKKSNLLVGFFLSLSLPSSFSPFGFPSSRLTGHLAFRATSVAVLFTGRSV